MGLREAWLTAALVALAVPPAEAMYGPRSDVAVLDTSNFKSTVLNSDQLWLAEFYAPWCGHCKMLQPEWEQAATALKGIVGVAAVDADAHQQLGEEYGIKGFPSIKLFLGGKAVEDYQGGRTAKAIVDYAMSQIKKVVSKRVGDAGGSSGSQDQVVTLTADNFQDLVLSSDDLWLVEFYAPWCGHCKQLTPEWEAAATELKGRANLGAVDATQETSLATRYNVRGYPTIKEFSNGKERDYEGGRQASDIITHVENLLLVHAKPIQPKELTGAAAMEDNCLSKQICLVAILPDILDSGAEGRYTYLEVLKKLGEQYKSRPWGIVWTAAGLQPDLESSLDIGTAGFPAFGAVSPKKSRAAKAMGAFAHDALKSFIDGMITGRTQTIEVSTIGEVVVVSPWDGKDSELIEEEEFDLSDLMNDEL